MTENAEPVRKQIDLNFLVGKEGMTGKDLLITLMGELNKQGYFLAGVIISNNPGDGFQIIGHLNTEWTLHAMKMVLDKFTPEKIANIETISMGGSN